MKLISGVLYHDSIAVPGTNVVIHCEEGKLIVTKETVLGETE